jgi:hypothetical protein
MCIRVASLRSFNDIELLEKKMSVGGREYRNKSKYFCHLTSF